MAENTKSENVLDKIEKHLKNTKNFAGVAAAKGMGNIREEISDGLSDVKGFFTPKELSKSVGLMMGSPMIAILGGKIVDIVNGIKGIREETKESKEVIEEGNSEEENRLDNQNKNNFLQEQIENEKMDSMDLTNDLLKDLVDLTKLNSGLLEDNVEATKDTDGGFIEDLLPEAVGSIIGGAGGIAALKSILGKGATTGGAGVATKATKGTGVFSKIFGKSSKLSKLGTGLKTGGKLLGKIALPITALFAGLDFVKGFKDSLEITGGEDDIQSKILAGLSEVVSGFTFGLLDSKNIFKVLDLVTDKLKDIVLGPFIDLRSLIRGEISLKDMLVNHIDRSSFGLFDKDMIWTVLTSVVDKWKDIFLGPFEDLKDLVTGKIDLKEVITNRISAITFGFIDKGTISNAVGFIGEKVGEMFNNAFSDFKDFMSGKIDLKELISSRVSALTFNFFSKDDVSKVLGFVGDTIKERFLALFTNFKDFVSGKIDFKELISSQLSAITFNIFKKEDFSKVVDFIGDKLAGLFIDPFINLKNVFTGEMSFQDLIAEQLSNVSLGFFTVEDMNIAIDKIKEMVGEGFLKLGELMATGGSLAFDYLKESATDFYTGAITDFSNNVVGFVSNIKDIIAEKVSGLFSDLADNLGIDINMDDIIDTFDKAKTGVENAIERGKAIIEDLKEKITNLFNIITNPIDFMSAKLSALNPFSDDEEVEVNTKKNKSFFSVLNPFSDDYDEPVTNKGRSDDYDSPFVPVKSQSDTVRLESKKIETQQIIMKKELAMMEKKQQQEQQQVTQSNNIITNQQSVIMAQDLSTRTDDSTYNILALDY